MRPEHEVSADGSKLTVRPARKLSAEKTHGVGTENTTNHDSSVLVFSRTETPTLLLQFSQRFFFSLSFSVSCDIPLIDRIPALSHFVMFEISGK